MPNLESYGPELPVAMLDILPNPVLIKDAETRYVWVNSAFEHLFSVARDNLVGELDANLFPGRQVAQCNGGDLRVLETGHVDEAYETVFEKSGRPVETITRKSRLVMADGTKLLVGIMHDITDISEANAQLEKISQELAEKAEEMQHLAETDALTHCLNRRALFESAENLEDGAPLGLAILDLDHFKSVNDTHGHEVGDTTLRTFAETVRVLLAEGELLARLGGEEFVLLLPGSSEARLHALTTQICDTWAHTKIETSETDFHSTVSIGAVHAPTGPNPAFDLLLAEADHLLYEAKANGRNQVSVSRTGAPRAA